jgi:hypothetical protein
MAILSKKVNRLTLHYVSLLLRSIVVTGSHSVDALDALRLTDTSEAAYRRTELSVLQKTAGCDKTNSP